MFDIAKRYIKCQRIDKIEVDGNRDIIVALKNGKVFNVGPFLDCELYWTDIQ